jgi:hypothetical protein
MPPAGVRPEWVGRPIGAREETPFLSDFYTPYWTTFELPPIDMKAASVGILDQIVVGLRQWSRKAGVVHVSARLHPSPSCLTELE